MGTDIPVTGEILDVAAAPLEEEMEDAYAKHANFRVIRRPSETCAWHLHGTELPEGYASIITGLMPVDKMLEASRSRGVTLTEVDGRRCCWTTCRHCSA